MLFRAKSLRVLGLAAGLGLTLAVATPASATVLFSLPLTDGGSNPLDLGSFTAGTILQLTFTGTGDLVDSRYQVNPDGSLAAPATGVYSFANFGATYPIINGGDGINHFATGGSTYDASGSGYPFAGPLSTDTTNSADIRFGSVVGTFSSSPARADWFFIGTGTNITIPAGGSHLFVAVNDTASGDNHGTFAGTLLQIPEPASALVLAAGSTLLLWRRKAR